jgi:hypothetical protein
MSRTEEVQAKIAEAREQGEDALEHGDVRAVSTALWAMSRVAPTIRDERVRTQSYRLYCKLQDRLTELQARRREANP